MTAREYCGSFAETNDFWNSDKKCIAYIITVLDLEKYGPTYDEEFKNKFFMGGHMNPCGYMLTAQIAASYIDYIIRHNIDDFKQVGFVSTDLKYTEK